MGIIDTSSEVIIGTENGTVKARAGRRLVKTYQWDKYLVVKRAKQASTQLHNGQTNI